MEPISFPGAYRHGKDLYTLNRDPGHRVYGEELRVESGVEYRRWDPWRSKLAAWLLRREGPSLSGPPRRVLYLGGAHGTTVSHLSDAWPDASIFVVEKAPLSFSSLLELAKRRENLLPILSDAQLPERYAADVGEAEFLYQDVAQRQQAGIFTENARAALSAGGHGLLMVKVRSVTQARSTRSVLSEARQEIARAGWSVRESTDLAPFARDHAAFWIES
jgi:fibrillarin-like pre-rRNA processing protein